MRNGERSPWSWRRLGRPLALWLGSFLAAATFLLIYWRIPLGPLLVGGGVTLLWTMVRGGKSY